MTAIECAKDLDQAIASNRPVVFLESTVISHGLPFPLNLETALACESVISDAGAIPATVGVVGGQPVAGLSGELLKVFALGTAPDGTKIEKVSLNNLAVAVVSKKWGATTVAASLRLAMLACAGPGEFRPVTFSTGGIGGVHRGFSDSLDISADLDALASTPLLCVCAGAKAILDLQKTREYLETKGVPVIGYDTPDFPAFYSRSSGLPVDVVIKSPEEAASLARSHWLTGSNTAVLVCVPIPTEHEVPADTIEPAVRAALIDANREGIRGKALTPFLLSRVDRLTGGAALAANRALLVNNARAAAAIALAMSQFG